MPSFFRPYIYNKKRSCLFLTFSIQKCHNKSIVSYPGKEGSSLSSTAKRSTLGTDFTEGAILPLLLRFMVPFLLASILNSLYNTVDMVIIGKFVGSSGTVAVSLGGKLLNLFTHMSIALAGGGQVLISQLVGAKRENELNETIGTLFTELFTLSLVFGAVSMLLSRSILVWLNTPAESFDQALAYLRITAAGLPLIFGYNAISSVLRAKGDSKHPLLFIAIAAGLNLILDIFFIVKLQMGAAGTALATVIGQGVSFLFSVFLMVRQKERFGFDFKLRSFAVVWDKLWIMVKIGFPMALRNFVITITQLYMMSYVNTYGLIEAAAYGIGDKLVMLTNVVAMSSRQAAGTIIAQNVGAKKPERVVTTAKCVFGVAMVAAVLLSILSLLIPKPIFSLFTSDPAVIAFAPAFLRVACIIYLLSASMGPFESVLTGTGEAKLEFLGGMLDGVVFRIGFSFLFGIVLGMGAVGFYLGDALARLGPNLVGGIYYFTGAWRRKGALID